jgi:hypothetical protein
MNGSVSELCVEGGVRDVNYHIFPTNSFGLCNCYVMKVHCKELYASLCSDAG